MGTSPLSAAEEEERQRRSMGTSPIAPGLLEAAAGGASCGADEAAPMETDSCSDAGSPAAFDDNESLDGSDGGGDETQEARGTLAAPHTAPRCRLCPPDRPLPSQRASQQPCASSTPRRDARPPTACGTTGAPPSTDPSPNPNGSPTADRHLTSSCGKTSRKSSSSRRSQPRRKQ